MPTPTLFEEDPHTQKVLAVYKRLGFQDPFEYALEKMRNNLGPQRVQEIGTVGALHCIFRDTGRTTYAICQAIAYVESTKRVVLLPGYQRKGVSDLQALVRQLCEQAKSEHRSIRVAGTRGPHLPDAVQLAENAPVIPYAL